MNPWKPAESIKKRFGWWFCWHIAHSKGKLSFTALRSTRTRAYTYIHIHIANSPLSWQSWQVFACIHTSMYTYIQLTLEASYLSQALEACACVHEHTYTWRCIHIYTHTYSTNLTLKAGCHPQNQKYVHTCIHPHTYRRTKYTDNQIA